MTVTAGDAHHGPLWQHMVVTILMGLIVSTVLTWTPAILGFTLAPERLSLLLQDQAQRRALRLVGPDGLPQIHVVDLPPLGGQDRRLVSRSEVADAVTALDEAGASVVLLDIDFSRPASNDAALTAALSNLHRSQVILPLTLAPRSSKRCTARTELAERAEQGLDQVSWPLADSAMPMPRVWYGHVETDADLDGVFRSVCPFVTAYAREPGSSAEPRPVAIPSAALLAAALANTTQPAAHTHWGTFLKDATAGRGLIQLPAGAKIESTPLKLETQPRRVHFLGQDATSDDSAHSIPRTALLPRELLAANADRSNIAGSLVLLGTSSALTGDQIQTPLGTMSGLFMITNLVANFAGDRFLADSESRLSHYLLECLFVTVGAIVFVALYDGLARGIARSRWGRAVLRSWLGRRSAALTKGLWLIVLSLLTGWAFVELNAWLAAESVAASVAVDPGIAILAILAERIIHIAGVLEGGLRTFVVGISTRLLRGNGGLSQVDERGHSSLHIPTPPRH